MEKTLGSLFSGSGGFELAGLLAGIKPLWNSEVCPFPILVTQKRLPRVKHYGDVSKLKGGELEAVDIITFGSPCQDLSVAGKRAGIVEGSRSNLFFEAIRIIKEMRESTNGQYPRYAVFENVAGIFSSHQGEDFRIVLESFCKVKRQEISIPEPQSKWLSAGEILGDDFSVAWRVLDAQYFSVPQRRARIFLVADFRGWSAGKILFESEGLSGDFESCNFPWQRTAASIEAGIGETSRLIIKQSAGFCTEHSAKARSIGYEEEKSPTLRAGVVPAALMFDNHAQDARYNGPMEESPTITARYGTGGGNTPIIAEPIGVSRHAKPAVIENLSPTLVAKGPHTVIEPKAFGICSKGSNAMQSDNPNSGFYEATISRTLDASGGNSLCSNQGGIAVVEAYNLTQNQAEKADVTRASDCSIGHLSSRQAGTAVVNATEDKAPVETYNARFTSEGTKNARGHCYKTDTSRCLDTGGESLESNHGGIAVISFAVNQRDEVRDLNDCAGAVQAQPGMKQQTFIAIQGSMIGRDDKNGPQGSGINEDVCFTLNCTDRHAVMTPTYCSSVGSFMHAEEEKSNTLMARDYKDPQIVNTPDYTVRRLTPLECSRLQGFPDYWCDDLAIPDPTEEELAFWRGVWKTWNDMNGKKPKTENQIRKWLASPYSDSEIYKLWGNGVALPCVFFVLSGIVWAKDA